MIEHIMVDDLCELNAIVNSGECKLLNKNALAGCLSSFHYYETLPEQVSSIFKSILLNHAFVDGNKRTALMFIGTLAHYETRLKINLNDDELYEFIISVINDKPTVHQIAKKLYSF